MFKLAKRFTLDAVDYVYIVIGCLITAVAFQVFLLPNDIVSGGVSGLSIIANNLYNLDPAIFQYSVNIPLLILCFVLLGKAAGYTTILGSLLLPFYLMFLGDLDPLTHDPFLAAVFGGVFTGLGLGIVFRAKATTGGTSVIVQLLYQFAHLQLGISTVIVDGFVIFLALVVFNPETVMYSLISLFLISRTIDLVQLGFNRNKNIFIISDSPQEIKREVLHTLERGVTNLGVRGGYGNTEKDMLMVVIQEREFTLLKETVLEVDPDAFVVAMSASEVLGRGFSLHKQFSTEDSNF